MNTLHTSTRWSIRRALLIGALPVAVASVPVAAQCPPTPGPPVTTDLWDVTSGAQVTGWSGGYTGWESPLAMFGEPGNFEGVGNTLFSDGHPEGFVHWVEWTTPAPVSVASFALYAGEESPETNFRRGFDRFTLLGWDGAAWVKLYDLVPSHPMPVIISGTNWKLNILADIAPFTGQSFRAEFVQRPPEWPNFILAGPRITELDAFSLPQGIRACNLADITSIGGTWESSCPDGQITVDDIIVFVNAFSDGAGCPGVPDVRCGVADTTGIGGPPATSDGQLTVDDIIAFVNAFSEGC